MKGDRSLPYVVVESRSGLRRNHGSISSIETEIRRQADTREGCGSKSRVKQSRVNASI